MRALVVVFLFVGLGMFTAAQDEETKCCCTTRDTSVCLANIHNKVDAELNAAYQEALILVEKSGSQDVENLKDAQEKWTAYRDAACKAEYGLWGGGSGGPNARAICVIRITRQRTSDLNSVYTTENR
jgi:uncharacterized protein YecT (DUF1311 family)